MTNDTTNVGLDLLSYFQLNRIILVIVCFVFLTLLVKIIQGTGQKIQEKLPAYRSIVQQVYTVLSYFIYIGGGSFLTYSILNPPRELLIAITGSAAVAIGFSLKDLVGSFIAGVVLLFDRPFQVGDRVLFDGVYGEIVTIGLRSVSLRTLDDSMYTIPNIKFLTETVSSGNLGNLDMLISVKTYIALDADIEFAKTLLYELVATSRFAYLKKAIKIVASEVEVAERLAIQLEVKAYVLDVKFEKDFQTDITSRVSRLFKKEKIKRPQL